MIRSIYAKILLWFWVVAIAAAATVLLVTNLTLLRPRARLWMSLASGVYAQGAVNAYQHGGKRDLSQFVEDVERSHGIRATLLDPQGQDLLAKGISSGTQDLLRKARETGKNQFRGGFVYTDVEPVDTASGRFLLVAEVHPWLALANPAVVLAMAFKILVALVSTGFLCTVLAHHFTAPIRALRAATRRVASGDLSVRTTPAIGSRSDELADLAHDFDRMATRLDALLQRQQEILGDISHELRSPLARLNLSLELLRRGEIDAAERLQTEVNRLDSLVGQILTLTRLQVHGGSEAPALVNLRVIVEGVAEDAQFEGSHEGKTVIVSRSDDCWLQADPALLRSCIENVVRNAVRFTRPQTEVTIELSRLVEPATDAAQIRICDRGDGVPEECFPRLFEPFYRVSEARDAGSGGFGLGLAIAHRIAHLYGGKITPHNRQGQGLEMRIHLPLAARVAIPA